MNISKQKEISWCSLGLPGAFVRRFTLNRGCSIESVEQIESWQFVLGRTFGKFSE
jgi:hypothetical protein